jgi:hypothetical protein
MWPKRTCWRADKADILAQAKRDYVLKPHHRFAGDASDNEAGVDQSGRALAPKPPRHYLRNWCRQSWRSRIFADRRRAHDVVRDRHFRLPIDTRALFPPRQNSTLRHDCRAPGPASIDALLRPRARPIASGAMIKASLSRVLIGFLPAPNVHSRLPDRALPHFLGSLALHLRALNTVLPQNYHSNHTAPCAHWAKSKPLAGAPQASI